jgi:opacity protein-like surface antigen
MKRSASLVLAAVLAMSGATAATAANHMSKMSKMSSMTSPKTTAASDTLTLSGDQQKSIWNDLSRQASNESAPSGFNVAVGAQVPSSMKTYPMPRQAARDVPAAKPYRYAMTQDKLLIVNPGDHKIADVVTKP